MSYRQGTPSKRASDIQSLDIYSYLSLVLSSSLPEDSSHNAALSSEQRHQPNLTHCAINTKLT
ncbi:hypothetical protein FCU94_13990 [Vibrio sp. JPW-9-11-11]|nr:hypothetical protein [Vibrio sp. JPW-9-11-11]